MKLMVAALGVLLGSFPASSLWADAMDQNLVAKWTFKGGSLDSEVGGFSFIEGGNKGTIEPEDGSVTVRGRKFLIASDITVEKFPELAKGATLWAKFKFETLPAENTANLMSLQTSAGNGSWQAIGLGLLYRGPEPDMDNPGLSVLARLKGGAELGVGVRRFIPVQAGEYVTAAIVFDSSAGTVSMWVNGQFVSSKGASGNPLENFEAFGIGQLMAPGAEVAVTFDEVRVYSTAFDSQWIEEITPTE